MDHGSKRAIIAAFLANLGIALQQVRRVRCSPARRRCWPRRSTRSPTPATRAAACSAARGRAGPPTRSTRSATARCATSGRSSSRSCCSASAACSRSSKASRSCIHPHELEDPRMGDRRAARRDGAGGVLVPHRAAREPTEARAGESMVAVHPPHEEPRAPGRAARGHRRARSGSRSRSSASRSPSVIDEAAGTASAASRSACCSSSIAIVLVIEMASLLVGEAAAPEVVARIRAVLDAHPEVQPRASRCAPQHLGPDDIMVERQGRVRPDAHGGARWPRS